VVLEDTPVVVLAGCAEVMGLPVVADTLAGRIEIHRLRPLSIAWLRDYVSNVVQREVPSVADIQLVEHLPRLLRLVAAAAPGPLNVTALTTALGAPRSTVDRYVAILRQVFLLDLDHARLSDWHSDRIGPLLETFVGCELQAQAGWADARVSVHWWRTGRGDEVDFVVERAGGSVVGIEVKAAATIGPGDFRGLRRLRDAMGTRLARGIVLYGGTEVLSFGDGMWAWPLSTLWAGRALPD
jgi:uncharacterized protein